MVFVDVHVGRHRRHGVESGAGHGGDPHGGDPGDGGERLLFEPGEKPQAQSGQEEEHGMRKEGPDRPRQGQFRPAFFRRSAELRREKEKRHGEEEVPRVLFELARVEPQPRIQGEKEDGGRRARTGQEPDRQTAEVPQGPQRKQKHGKIQRPTVESQKTPDGFGKHDKARGRGLTEGIGGAGEQQLPQGGAFQPEGESQRVMPELPAAVTVDAEETPRKQSAVDDVPAERNSPGTPPQEKGTEKGEKKGTSPEEKELFPKINGGVPRPPRSEVPGKSRSKKEERNARRGGQENCRRKEKPFQQKGGAAGVFPQSFPAVS